MKKNHRFMNKELKQAPGVVKRRVDKLYAKFKIYARAFYQVNMVGSKPKYCLMVLISSSLFAVHLSLSSKT